MALLPAYVGFYTLALVDHGYAAFYDILPLLPLTTEALAAHLALTLVPVLFPRVRRSNIEEIIFPLVVALNGLGLLMLQRLAPNFLRRQIIWTSLGIGVMLLLVLIPRDLRWLRRYRYTWLLLGMALVILTVLFGVHPMGAGARLWLGIGGFYFQSSELLKILVIVFLAGYLDEKRELLTHDVYRVAGLRVAPLPYLVPLLMMWGFAVLLLVWQRDLGAALLFFVVLLSMLYAASGRGLYIWLGLAMFIAAAIVATFIFPHVGMRVAIWRDPWRQSMGDAYQLVQGLLAVIRGGVFGQGIGYSYADYVPLVHTDFIFVAISEELGLMGIIAVLLLYILLMQRGFHIALYARSGFKTLLSVGLTSLLAWQAWIVAAGNLKLIPLTGATLPFISYGGSSLLTSYTMIGLILFISASNNRDVVCHGQVALGQVQADEVYVKMQGGRRFSHFCQVTVVLSTVGGVAHAASNGCSGRKIIKDQTKIFRAAATKASFLFNRTYANSQ